MITSDNIDDDSVVGRLGNKLFVIATVIATAKRNNDIAVFPHWKYESVFPNIPISNDIKITNRYSETAFHYTPIPYSADLSLRGYFQSYKYFDDYRDDIIQHFKMNIDPILNNLYDYANTVSIHIRRTDYINKQQYHPVLSLEYYKEAILQFNGYSFLIFSDDINWCKSVFKGNAIFVEGRKDYEDLYIMSQCKHNIIANSSFSWWAAYLNKNTHKKVITPKQWFGSAYSNYNTNDLRPNDWILL